MDSLKSLLTESLNTGFIDNSITSDVLYQPELLTNQKKPPKKILSTILNELDKCEEFYISVAFVTTSGVATLINKLIELESRGIKGKILVSQYLNFTQPEALKRLLQFKNIELRIAEIGNVHIKGYIFRHEKYYNLIIGSSNLTAKALAENKEWNIKVSALGESGIVDKVINEFNADFTSATIVTPEFIKHYLEIYQKQLLFSNVDVINPEAVTEYKPNSMQSEALGNLKLLRESNKNKSLIISATGTGKTFLSAFDAKEFNPKKLLFVVHRLNIAKSALNTFSSVFEDSKSFGLFSGNIKDLEADFIFSTVQTISKTQNLEMFNKNHFDYIIIDETHRSAANSYLKIINYFEPKFLLGMTATPERSDGENIFELFDHNIAYEIRLNRAMEENMLSPFHYYGVSDINVEGEILEDNADFNLLVSIERVEKIIQKSKFYGCDNGITRGLIFCSRIDEAKELSELLNLRGYNTIALTGDSSENERSDAIDLLETDNISEKLDYILTVDVFNEGIDIPKVNQIIMLRPTSSAIIFIQQLGRGLRKVDGKSYLTVIDFIGNYENNYLIPIALYGDTSYNKDSLRKLIKEGSRMIPGSSTINFDEITKERIFQSIDSANMQLLTDLKKDYNILKYRLGKIPMMMDFIEHGSRDPYLYVDYSRYYLNIVNKIEKNYYADIGIETIKILELFAKEINNGKRVIESIIMQMLLNKEEVSFYTLNKLLILKYSIEIDKETFNSCINNLNFSFVRKEQEIIDLENDKIVFSSHFNLLLENNIFYKYLADNISYGIHTFDRIFNKDLYRNGFVLFQKYSRKDVCRILNWDYNEEATVYGYKFNNNTCPIFVNYHKEENIASSTKFPEKFINISQFLWYSKPKRKLTSGDIIKIRHQENNLRLPFFIKKHNGEGSDFYYMGDVVPIDDTFEQTTIKNDKNEDVDVVKVLLQLDQPIENSLYNYITANEKLEENSIVNEEIKEVLYIPLYNFYAAAGSFSEIQSDGDYELIEAPKQIKNPKNYFACKIVGESMNRVIPNGSICLFKQYEGGSRNGKIVLVENRDIQDPDFNSAYTLKTYSSEKVVSEEGWSHISIKLLPHSYDYSYEALVIDESNAENMTTIGEFVSIISN